MNQINPPDQAVQDFLKEATLQSQEYVKQLVSAGQLLNESRFCELLDLESETLEAGCVEGRFFWVVIEGHRYFPSFYSSQTTTRGEIEETSAALGDCSWSQKWQFFTRPKGSLGGITPLDALSKGLLERVLIAAKGFRER